MMGLRHRLWHGSRRAALSAEGGVPSAAWLACRDCAVEYALSRRIVAAAGASAVSRREPDESAFLAGVDARIDAIRRGGPRPAAPARVVPSFLVPTLATAGVVMAAFVIALTIRQPERAPAAPADAPRATLASALLDEDLDLEAILSDPELARDMEAERG
jgi:hypothetical protein